VVLRGQFCILASCCLSPMRRNSVLEELRVSKLAVNFSVTKSSSEGTRSRGEPGVGFSSVTGEFRDDWSMLFEYRGENSVVGDE